MTATKITAEEQYTNTYYCTFSAKEAAAKLNVSVATIRRAARNAGVAKIGGVTVAGFLKFDRIPVDVVLPYSA